MIQLSKKYRINFDPSNVIIEKYFPGYKNRAGELIGFKPIAYFGRIENAFRFYIDQELKESSNLKDMFQRMAKLEKQVSDLFEYKIDARHACAIEKQ